MLKTMTLINCAPTRITRIKNQVKLKNILLRYKSIVSEYNFIEVISIKYVINNIEFVVTICISVLAIIVSAVVAKSILKKELQENRKLELELKMQRLYSK